MTTRGRGLDYLGSPTPAPGWSSEKEEKQVEFKKLSEHIWYMPFEEERDRPNLGYVTLIVTGTPIENEGTQR